MTYDQAAYWDNQPTDQPWLLNGFKGTWNFSDHKLIPGPIASFLSEYFYGYERLARVPLEEINKVMNEVWEGPGSMGNLVRMAAKIRAERLANGTTSKDPLKGYSTPTVDSDLEESDEDFELEIDEE